jgi:hypothetical protein
MVVGYNSVVCCNMKFNCKVIRIVRRKCNSYKNAPQNFACVFRAVLHSH